MEEFHVFAFLSFSNNPFNVKYFSSKGVGLTITIPDALNIFIVLYYGSLSSSKWKFALVLYIHISSGSSQLLYTL